MSTEGQTSTVEVNGGRLQDFTIDQLAGASALLLGSIGGLLMIIWKSRCLCRCRIGCSDSCYLFDCAREPPQGDDSSDEENNTRAQKGKNTKGTLAQQENEKTKTPANTIEPSRQQTPEPEIENP
tara:strand:+ start:464 stop:838 length:375 start_codon:yes stop_codon:yes gene_type:complete